MARARRIAETAPTPGQPQNPGWLEVVDVDGVGLPRPRQEPDDTRPKGRPKTDPKGAIAACREAIKLTRTSSCSRGAARARSPAIKTGRGAYREAVRQSPRRGEPLPDRPDPGTSARLRGVAATARRSATTTATASPTPGWGWSCSAADDTHSGNDPHRPRECSLQEAGDPRPPRRSTARRCAMVRLITGSAGNSSCVCTARANTPRPPPRRTSSSRLSRRPPGKIFRSRAPTPPAHR